MTFFFILVTIVFNIVMLNLLISIITASYEKVVEKQQQTNDFERCDMIADNSDLVPTEDKEKLCKNNEFLVVAKKIKVRAKKGDDDDEDEDSD